MNMLKMFRREFSLLTYKSITLLFFLVCLFIFLLFSTYNNVISMDSSETPIISLNPVYLFFAFIIFFICLILVQPVLEKINSMYLFLAILTVFVIFGIYLVTFSDTFLRGSNPSSPLRVDPGSCISVARHFNNGNFIDLKSGGYVNMYPYQLYWITLLRLFLGISNSVRFLYWVMLFFAVTAIILIYLISCLIFNKKSVINTSTILTFLFLPNLFNVLFIYANLPAYVFFLLGIYLFLLSNKKLKYLIYFSTIFFCIAALLKNNFLIGLIAFIIMLTISDKKWVKKVEIILLSFLIISGCNLAIGKYYSSASNLRVSLKSGMPKTAFLLMGLKENGIKDGWFDGVTVRMYESNHYSTGKTNSSAKKALKNRINTFKQHPKYMNSFFVQKWKTTWSDPSFQSLWNAPMPTQGGRLRTKMMKRIYTPNSKTSYLIRRVSLFSVLSILLGSILFAFINLFFEENWTLSNRIFFFILSFLFLIGGFVFHTFWETKTQYVWQYVMTLIPVGSYGISNLKKFLKELATK